jgi:hypothetical protein
LTHASAVSQRGEVPCAGFRSQSASSLRPRPEAYTDPVPTSLAVASVAITLLALSTARVARSVAGELTVLRDQLGRTEAISAGLMELRCVTETARGRRANTLASLAPPTRR